VELHEALRLRAMVRSFSAEPVDPSTVERLVGAALRSPTAGNTGGTAWVVLCGPDETSAYWDATTDDAWRAAHPGWAEGLRRAPVLLLAYASPPAYVARYAETDKADPALGRKPEDWTVPYWFGDAAFGVMTVLLGAVDAGLGACVLGNFRGEQRLASDLGVPAGWRLFGAVALGRADGAAHRSSSLDRPVPPTADRVHHGRW
jgi:nitroreductase